MDPKATLAEILDPETSYTLCQIALQDLDGWLARGGFPPDDMVAPAGVPAENKRLITACARGGSPAGRIALDALHRGASCAS